jgi:FkbM family methyltransferase
VNLVPVKQNLRKLLLTVQSDFPFVAGAKERLYYHSRRYLRIPHESDFRILTLIRASSQDCYIDVGANKGQSIESILLFKPDAQIISFEPNPGLAGQLAKRYKHRKSIQVMAQGLADRMGQFTLFVPFYKRLPCYDLASLNRDSAANWINEDRVFGFNSTRLRIAEVECQVSTLDTHKLSPIFMKIDVQGFEYNVLKGALTTLRRSEPVLLIEDYRGDPRTIQLAESLGYQEYRFDGAQLVRGQTRGDNSLLITPTRVQQLRLQ